MSHFSENSCRLSVKWTTVQSFDCLSDNIDSTVNVYVVRLPAADDPALFDSSLTDIDVGISNFASKIRPNATIVVIGEIIDLIRVQAKMPEQTRYQHWIAAKRATPKRVDVRHLANEHFGVLIHTHYPQSLKHTKTRIHYTYCPACDKTTKDYGGKKHTYHAEGTLLSDIWRDIDCDLDGDISPIIERLADLFGIEEYKSLEVLDCSGITLSRTPPISMGFTEQCNIVPDTTLDRIIQGDCIEELKSLPDNSIDFVFADPPYNLRKQYMGYSDDLLVKEYFKWCDQWIAEVSRILKPGRTFALLNIPLWSVRHFLFAETQLTFQNWIAWDALSFPVRLIMPAHYTILCFSKGQPRPLPGLINESGIKQPTTVSKPFDALNPLADNYCLRSNCVDERTRKSINDRSQLTDLWTDIHRLKHNSRRVDHPCQLPPQLMYRLISIFTKQGESVLDCFNGAGTTTLTAHQLQRRYVGIEASSDYCKIAEQRHSEISDGCDPFRKATRALTVKNSPVARLQKQKYTVSKKVLQLEVKRLSQVLGHIPNHDEVEQNSLYPIKYYDDYFASWGEVTAAARTTGMTENRDNKVPTQEASPQLRLLE